LTAITSAQKAVPLAVALRVLRLAPARFHAWRGLANNCTLDDMSSCPHTTPAQLTADEIATIGNMVQDASFRHMSLRALALHAQRIGRVFAAVSTWARLVRSPTGSCLAQLVGRQSKTRPDFPIHLQFRACCICATKSLECPDS
jgi:hypothetical protein